MSGNAIHFRRLPPKNSAVQRFVEELWCPYHRTLATTVAAHALAADVMIDQVVSYWIDRLNEAGYQLWIARSGTTQETPLSEKQGTLVGFIGTELLPAPAPFDRPDRLLIGDFFVSEDYRGTGLADDLLERAAQRAREEGCSEIALDVDIDNDRALAFYRRHGFTVARHRMRARIETL